MDRNRVEKARIMIVDDTPANLKLLDQILRDADYRVFAFPRAEMALRAAGQNPPDLILLDINMPQMNGYEACEILKKDPELCDIPVMFISALNDAMDKVRAFQAGAVDYINKPFQIEEVLARVETHLKMRQMHMEMEKYNHHLEEQVAEQVKEIAESQLATIIALARLAESRDDTTGKHLERVQAMSKALTDRMKMDGLYAELTESCYAQNLYFACSLHDIGKVGIPDRVLLKPSGLTIEEFELMKTHTLLGAETLQTVYEKYPNNQLIKMAQAIARWHHERWDGSGYPDGLAGNAIPLSARIMSVVDVYDALRSKRPYKDGFSHQKSLDIMSASSGHQFDPAILSAFMYVEQELERIFDRYSGKV